MKSFTSPCTSNELFIRLFYDEMVTLSWLNFHISNKKKNGGFNNGKI